MTTLNALSLRFKSILAKKKFEKGFYLAEIHTWGGG